MDPTALSLERARLLRLRAQRLDRRWATPAGAAEVVRQLCGVHAQLPSTSALAVRPRSSGLLAGDVDRARFEQRTLVRTWTMRGTLHLMAADDLGWLQPLLAPTLIAGSRRRHADLRLDEDTFARSSRIVREALAAHGPLTRGELAGRLAAAGVDPSGQRIAHLVWRAGLEGVLCYGPDRGRESTLVLLDDWADRGRRLDREAALVELARRYLAAYGPAEPRDLAAWSGLPVRDARAAWSRISGELVEVLVAGQPAWLPAVHAGWPEAPEPDAPLVHLLPGFDVYLLGYRDRALAVPEEHGRAVWTGGGFIRPTLTVDGRAVATWASDRSRRGLKVTVAPFGDLGDAPRAGLEAEAADLGRFLDTTASVAVGPASRAG
jgi:Winged helix DNA-binding domain